MEPTNARRAFPCWDDPAAKAHFSLHIRTPSSMPNVLVLGNMPLLGQPSCQGPALTWDFQDTPLMSPHLLAWAIGEMTYGDKLSLTKDDVSVGVYAVKDTPSEDLEFSRQIAVKALEFFTRYTAVRYELPKLTLVAIPDMAHSAMGNWGLVLARPSLLLCNPVASTLASKQRVASTVARELAHQWFGNLVTFDWWDDLWLAEGFACWFGQLAVADMFPEWEVWAGTLLEEFGVECQSGMLADALPSTQSVDVGRVGASPLVASQILDPITYSKSSSLVRMLERVLGDAPFRAGIRHYLTKHRCGNVKTDDLWRALQQASSVNVRELMGNWMEKPGYPIIEASKTREGKVSVRQKRFGLAGCPHDETLWHIPLFLQPDGPPSPIIVMLKEREKDINIDLQLVNAGLAGFYRVRYSPRWLDVIGQDIRLGNIQDPLDRAGLLSDLYAVAMLGECPLTTFLQFSLNYVFERSRLVWGELLRRLAQICALVADDKALFDSVRKLIGTLTAPVLKILEFCPSPQESANDTLLRPLLYSYAGFSGNQQAIGEAMEAFKRFVWGVENAVPFELRRPVFEIAIREQPQHFGWILEHIYRNQPLNNRSAEVLLALPSGSTPDIIHKALALTLNTDAVRSEDAVYIFRAASANPYSKAVVWSFLKEKWPFFEHHLFLPSFVNFATSNLHTEEDAADVERFFNDRPLAKMILGTTLDRSLEKIRINTRCIFNARTGKEDLGKWLDNNH